MSTGGMQALYLSANHPDVFGNVGLFSAYSANTFAGLRHPEFYLGLSRKLRAQFAQAPDNYVIMIGHADIFYPLRSQTDRIRSPGRVRWTLRLWILK